MLRPNFGDFNELWRSIMDGLYIGLDVSDKVTHICCVDYSGKVIWRGEAATDPEALSANLVNLPIQ